MTYLEPRAAGWSSGKEARLAEKGLKWWGCGRGTPAGMSGKREGGGVLNREGTKRRERVQL